MTTLSLTSQISPMTSDEVGRLVRWARVEGWMPSDGDAEVFRAADPAGFLAARVGGEMVAGISCVRWGPHYAFVGLFIAQPEWRSQGIGGELVGAALEHAGDRVIGLDGVPEQVEYYKRLGVRMTHLNVRYATPPGSRLADLRQGPPARAAGFTLVPGTRANQGAAVAYDGAFFPGDRRAFMASWLAPASPWRRWMLAQSPDGHVVGLGAVRSAPPGHKVGPLHADTPQIADSLLRALAGDLSGPVFLDIPDANPDAVELVTGLGMSPVFQCARMYRGPAPELPVRRSYGVCTLELG